jgi:hypothetical protein
MMDYQEALKNAPIWIQKAWMEFNKLPKETQAKTLFLYFSLNSK